MKVLNTATERRLFQIIVLLASIVPIAAGTAGVLVGARMLHGLMNASADLESHFGYLSGLLFGIGLAFGACVADLDRRAGLYRALSLIVILGGLGRVLAAIEHGAPTTGANRAAFIMELVVVPLLLLWMGRIERRCGLEAGEGQSPNGSLACSPKTVN